MNNIKRFILKMPAWKAFIFVLFILFGMSITFETILSHTVFHIVDKALIKLEADKSSDLADMDEMEAYEQVDYCNKYKEILEEKKNIKMKLPDDFSYDFDLGVIHSHEQDIVLAIKNHHFDLEKCEKTLKRNKS